LIAIPRIHKGFGDIRDYQFLFIECLCRSGSVVEPDVTSACKGRFKKQSGFGALNLTNRQQIKKMKHAEVRDVRLKFAT
jgi:hypothetical protein